MTTEQCVSAYATAKICGFNGSYSDFKKLYDQYCDEIIETLPNEKPQLAKAEPTNNPFRTPNYF